MALSSLRVKTTVAAGILVLGIGVAGYQLYEFISVEKTQLDEARHKAEGELATKQSELRKLQEFAKNIESVKTELKELNLQLESALEHMPRSFNLSGLLRKLTMLGQNSGLDVLTFKPKNDEKKESFYSSTSLDIESRGTFTQTLVFFDQIARMKRIINITDLKMKGTDAQRGGTVIITTQASLRTFRFSE